jgi:hypothetical protein
MANGNGTATRTYDVTYTPDYVQRQIAGAKGTKGGRPFIFDVRFFKVRTKTGDTVVGTYLLFGGVPTPNLHDQLIEAGFKVRRRARTWEDKKNNVTVDIADRENECYAVYYNTEPTISDVQIKVIAGIMKKGISTLPERKQTFLLPSWAAVEKGWGATEKWLDICAVSNDDDDDQTATVVDDTIDLDEIKDLF